MNLLDFLFGCTHESYSWPQRHRNRMGILQKEHVCCLSCGKPAEYDWQEMKPIWHPRKAQRVLLVEEMEGQ